MAFNAMDIFSNIKVGAILNNIFNVVGLILIALLVGGCVFMYFRWQKRKKSGDLKEIQWWEEVSGQLVPVRKDTAKEIIIPGTNLRVFYIRDKNTWLPRFSRGITSNMFFVAITKNKELINFTLKSIDDHLAKGDLTFDHTDMRWAAENLREFVKRNYKDKAVTWWKEYAQVIGVVIFIVFMTISLATIIYFMKGMVEEIGVVVSNLADAIDKINACSPGSGVVISE